jgi:hypothetical protein
MKYFTSWLLLFAFLYSNSVLSQNDKTYTVQVGTFLDAKAADFEPVRPLGMVYAQQLDNNLFRVFIGGYDEEQSARQVVRQLRGKGYSSAIVIEIPIEEGRTVTVIQFEMVNAKKKIDWHQYTDFENLFAIIRQDVVKLVTGPYPSLDAARGDLENIRKKGYADAFIKRVNTAYLQEITSFETGIKQPLIPLSLEGEPTAATARNIPQSYDHTTPRSPEAGAAPYANVANTKLANYDMPDIRANVKRRSALELQRVLKEENAYRGQLDGLYGSGTESAYKQVLRHNRDLQKYQVLAKSMTLPASAGPNDQLQAAINDLHADPQAPALLERSNHPIAKAYRAYWLFTRMGAGNEINNLMNNAIRQAYSGQQLDGKAPFDYNATYAYQDLDQLLLHLYFIHLAPNVPYAAPCWLFQRHPQQAPQAMSKAMSSSSNSQLQLQSCDPFLNWEEARIALAVAIDLNGSPQINPAPLQRAASERARLYLTSRPLSNDEMASVEKWNAELLANLNGWATLDPLNQRLAKAFKIAYFQTQVRLEDFFMDKGLSLEESKGLALATLKTLVGPHVDRFV